MTGPDPLQEAHFMVHGGGQALSFYRAWPRPEQTCIEAVYLELAVFDASKWKQAGNLPHAQGKKMEASHAAGQKEGKVAWCMQGTQPEDNFMVQIHPILLEKALASLNHAPNTSSGGAWKLLMHFASFVEWLWDQCVSMHLMKLRQTWGHWGVKKSACRVRLESIEVELEFFWSGMSLIWYTWIWGDIVVDSFEMFWNISPTQVSKFENKFNSSKHIQNPAIRHLLVTSMRGIL